MKKRIPVFLVVLLAVAVMAACAAAAPVSISVDVTVEAVSARGMLQMINDFRTGSEAWYWNSDNSTKTVCTGLGTLVYDYDLEEAAIQRAVETALHFDHTRPNNTVCFSAFPPAVSMGENIAAGQRSAEAAFVAWREDQDDYKGQGHRRNMLYAGFNCIGIGHVIVDGIHYWTQALAWRPSPTTVLEGPEPDGFFGMEVQVAPELVQAAYAEGVTLEVDRESGIPDVTFTMTETWPYSRRIRYLPYDHTLDPVWTVADPEKIQLESGLIRGLNAGETVMTADVFGKTATSSIRVMPKDIDAMAITLYAENEIYNALPHTPPLTVMDGEKYLTEGVDYSVAYSNNIDGTDAAMAMVTGLGNYTGSVLRTFIIQKAPLSVKALDQTIIYGEAPVPDGLEISGFFGEDSEASLGGKLEFLSNYERYGDVGVYTLTPSGLTSDNYELTCYYGVLEVLPREVGIVWSDTIQTYTGNACPPTATVTGTVNGDKITAVVEDPAVEAGTYTARIACLTGDQVINYTLPEGITTEYTIVKAVPELTAPVAIQGLISSGKAQKLVEAGFSTGGVMEYSLRKDGAYSENIPSATEAGSYSVWYRVRGDRNYEDIAPQSVHAEIKQKTVKEVTVNGGVYALNLKAGTASLKKPAKKNAKSLTIEASVSANGTSYAVTSIGSSACKGMKKLTKVTIGANVTSIGKNAFKGCTKLKTITINTKKLTAKSIGADAFRGISSKATVKCPKGMAKTYAAVLKKKGVTAKATFK